MVEDGFVAGLGLIGRSGVCQPLADGVDAGEQLLRGVEGEQKIVALELGEQLGLVVICESWIGYCDDSLVGEVFQTG